ncbi:DNA-3-methyladenine glycosylase I [Pacificibacter maritimus]|uniref:DNA-3-methyladenine glycosylase I n=1 Tax=Pacificibacter maritimus TaxID=762213 RepID=A0A3N4VDE7_9RHOB|nr:DNA-3-methyladenine glycosylase I [Pacificibacter maritimus]RPE70964.1 DNA-3-methyladenine glycosylase I [Pacificibacter maritimus]
MQHSKPSDDGRIRCNWAHMAPDFPLYQIYHDTEWGMPQDDDQCLFEKLCLESFQSGLSWRTILAKRDNFRAAFDDFDFHKIAQYDEADVERLLQNAGIIRHRGKITATINNAQRALDLIASQGSLGAYIWQFEPSLQEVLGLEYPAATSASSVALSKDLKKRGWKFVGPTTIYAFMQSMGLVNDHASDCICHATCEAARAGFIRPK